MTYFGRVSTAMVTPFDGSGNIDFDKTTKLVEHLLANGSDSLVVCGTTGESPTLSKLEKLEMFKHVVKVVNGRVNVIAGTGSNNTKETIELTKMAEYTGVNAILLVTPYYNKPSQDGLFQHFTAVAESTDLPVMLYNVPGRTVANLLPETVIRLSKVKNIVAIKEASGNLSAMSHIISSTDESFELYCGDDGLTLPAMSVGAKGVISVASHVIGPEIQEMIRELRNGNIIEAGRMHRNQLPLVEMLFSAPSPVPVKTALNLLGIDVGGVRMPLVDLNPQSVEELKKVVIER